MHTQATGWTYESLLVFEDAGENDDVWDIAALCLGQGVKIEGQCKGTRVFGKTFDDCKYCNVQSGGCNRSWSRSQQSERRREESPNEKEESLWVDAE